MYFNTTHETGQLLLDYEAKTKNQDSLVLKTFRILGKPLTAYEIWVFLSGNQYISPSTPITSIRRSITDLTNEGKLFKTDQKGDGGMGRKTFKWNLSCAF